MKPFRTFTIAYVAVSAVLFMAGTTLLPEAGLGGLVRDVLMLGVSGVILYALLTMQAARRDAEAAPKIELEPVPNAPQPAVLIEQESPLRQAA